MARVIVADGMAWTVELIPDTIPGDPARFVSTGPFPGAGGLRFTSASRRLFIPFSEISLAPTEQAFLAASEDLLVAFLAAAVARPRGR